MMDDSWEEFPEIGAALQDAVPGTRECFCIAKNHSHRTWPLGVHERGGNRCNASNIACKRECGVSGNVRETHSFQEEELDIWH